MLFLLSSIAIGAIGGAVYLFSKAADAEEAVVVGDVEGENALGDEDAADVQEQVVADELDLPFITMSEDQPTNIIYGLDLMPLEDALPDKDGGAYVAPDPDILEAMLFTGMVVDPDQL